VEPELKLENMECDGEKCNNEYDGDNLFFFDVQSITESADLDNSESII